MIKKTIYHSRGLLLFNHEQMQMKKGGDLFYVSMGKDDGAELI